VPTRLQRSRSFLALASVVGLLLTPALHASDQDPVIVHEWGTFTSLQDEDGNALGGINVDDEPVPNFVCTDGGHEVQPQHQDEGRTFGLPPYWIQKSLPANDPEVTMRLETPVLYIYPPKGEPAKSVPPLTVHVDFHGGILSEFFPLATFDGLVTVPGTSMHQGALTSETTTSLTWSGIRLGSTRKPPATTDHVWTIPRETSAPVLELDTPWTDYQGTRHHDVTAEHFLFYRGVGQIDSPVQLSYHSGGGVGMTHSLLSSQALFDGFDKGWMAEIRPNGTCAFNSITSAGVATVGGMIESFTPHLSTSFKDADFTAANLARLKASMQEELVREGLFTDEASALLRTWELSYFKSPGLRFFYTLPRSWTDAVLPLKVTGAPAKITRVMIGRIELISDTEKAALARLPAGPVPNLEKVKEEASEALDKGNYTAQEKLAFYRGDRPLSDLDIAIPPRVQDYLDLGRFRDVLVLREQKERPSAVLAQFIRENYLGGTPSREDAPKPVGSTASN
jgi:hypothetical protein